MLQLRIGMPILIVLMLGIASVSVPSAGVYAQDAEATISALQTQVAELSTPATTPEPTPSAGEATRAPGDPRSSSKSVNVEIILDVSGSMTQIIDTGETRMDAAKRVLNEVVATIPNEPGINVGLRIYGHLGNNTEEGRPVSCQSSELVVPINGVDQTAISQQIAPLFPTGWTPLALSLEGSAADFPTDDPDAANAVILVTDGLETCGGDPAAAAAALVGGDPSVVTHVIGFALTPEEQQILESITAASGGMLLGAANANELSAALFTVLEELEILVGNGYMGGNAFSLIGQGEPGTVSIVTYGAPDPFSGSVPFVVRNNTDQDVYDVQVSATVRDAAGSVLAAGDDQGVQPFHIQPGTLGIGHIYFDGLVVPADASMEFRVETAEPNELRYTRTRDLETAEASLFEDRIVGQVENPQDGNVEGILRIAVTCFDLGGTPLNDYWDFVETNQLAPGQLLPFQATLHGVQAEGCPAFLVAGQGQCPSCSVIAVAADVPQTQSDPAQAPGSCTPTGGAETAADDRFATVPLPGIRDVVLRTFRFTGNSGLLDFTQFVYSVLEFDTDDQADKALEEAVIRYLDQREEPIEGLMPTSAPDLGDRTIAYLGNPPNDQFDITLGILAVRDGSLLHILIGTRIDGDPLPIMTEAVPFGLVPVEERDRGAHTVTGLNSGGLWDVVPRPEDLGDGYIVLDEIVPKMFGPVPRSSPTP